MLAAPFELGPVEEIVDISNERELVERFGKPNDNNFEYWFTAAQFLSYGGVLKTVRVTSSTTLKNSVDTGTAPLNQESSRLRNYLRGCKQITGVWAARTAGSKGNSIGIFVTDAGADQIAVIPATNWFW